MKMHDIYALFVAIHSFLIFSTDQNLKRSEEKLKYVYNFAQTVLQVVYYVRTVDFCIRSPVEFIVSCVLD